MKIVRAAMVVLLVVVLGCGDEEARTTIRLHADPEGRAPAYGEAAWPTDAWRASDGRLEPVVGLEAITPDQAEELSLHFVSAGGFGVRPLVELFVDGDLDPSSVPASTSDSSAALIVIDVDPASPARGTVVPYDWRYDAARHVIGGSPSPGTVLAGARRYAAIATTALRDAKGASVGPAPSLAEWLAGEPAPARWASTAEVARELGGQFPAGIAGVAVFTTQDATATLASARGLLSSEPTPSLSFETAELIFHGEALDALLGEATRGDDGEERWGWSNPTGIAHDHVGVIATGTMTVARFTRERLGTGGPEDETFLLDAGGLPAIVEPAHPIPVTFVLPIGPPPAGGYPVAVFGHGLGAGRHAVVTFAEPLTRAGFAVVAIDLADHGSRFRDIDEGNEIAEIIPGFTGDASLSDGFGDSWGLGSTLELLRGFENLSAVRDSIRQSALDLSQVVRLLRRTDLDLSALSPAYGGLTPRLDAERIAYLGESFGAHVGVVFSAIEPDVDLYILDVPGGGLIDLEIASSPEIGSMLIPFVRLVYDFQGPFDRFHPLVALAQTILDAADPLTYAPHVLTDRLVVEGKVLGPRHLLAIEVIHDELIPNEATHALARAMGLPVLEPELVAPPDLERVLSPASANWSGQSAALVQYAPATHGANWTSETGLLRFYPGAPHPGDEPFPPLPEPIAIANPLYETLEQVLEALTTHQAGQAPVFRSTLPPKADFDGDGILDDEELAAGGDPHDPAN